MRNAETKKLLLTLIALILAAGLKAFYSAASVNDLRWILAPTTFFVEIVTAQQFHFESYEGYINSDYSFLIADSCSGVNFLIAAFLMMSLMSIWKVEDGRPVWRSIPFGFLVAYITTLAANTVRISLAVKLHEMESSSIWVNPEQLHRFQGIFIYFGFLMLLFVLFDRVQRQDPRKSVFRYVIPLSIYWLITLGVPLLNGAFAKGIDLREHFVFVIAMPVLIMTPLILIEVSRRARPHTMR